MNKIISIIILFLLVAVHSGCSSIATHSRSDVIPAPYAGTNIAITKTKKIWRSYDFYGQLEFYFLDVPFSFIADTVLYPIDIYRLNKNMKLSK